MFYALIKKIKSLATTTAKIASGDYRETKVLRDSSKFAIKYLFLDLSMAKCCMEGL